MTRAEQIAELKEILLDELNYRVCQNTLSAKSDLYDVLEGNNLQALKGLYRMLFGYGYEC